MPSKKKTLEIIESFKNYINSNDSIPDDSDDEPIEAVKTNVKIQALPKSIKAPPQVPKEVISLQAPDPIPEPATKKETATEKKKRIQSEAQKLNTQKMREKLKEAQERKKQEKAERDAMERAILDEKIVKKAISIKKKQIKKEKVLDEISDDETPMEEIVKKIRQVPSRGGTHTASPTQVMYQPPKPPEPKFTLKFHK
jgi:hypothetical protein